MNRFFKYIQYKLNSKTKHDIHSPFVFDFVTKCLSIKPNHDFHVKLTKLHNQLIKNTTEISIEDFGAGSHKLSNKRKIKDIYYTASAKGVYAKLLYQISNYYQPKNILELGTSLGIGTIHLASGNPNSTIFTVDACKNTLKYAKKNFQTFGLKNIQSFNSTFSHFIENEKLPLFDVIYIDGHHEGSAMLDYINKLDPYIHDESIIILDDIIWSQDMNDHFKKLINNDKFHVTIDLFRMGIICKRPHQEKQHFIIKLKNIISGFI